MTAEPQSSLLQGTVAFTGRLAAMKRQEAFALVRSHGGVPRRGVTRSTHVIVVGELGWPLLSDGRPSKSLALARSYGIAIASEREFLRAAGRIVSDDTPRTYSAIQIASLSGLPSGLIEELTAFGLLDPRDGRYGFRDLAAARQLAELFAAEVSLSTITRSLHEIRKWLPDASLCNVRLYPASSDAVLVAQLKGHADRRGQMILPIAAADENADELFEQAQTAEERNDVELAERVYRKVMRIDPADPTAAFNLGNLQRRAGKKLEAEKAYRAALDADRDFAEAWYNLADLLDEQRKSDEAVVCLERAIAADPHYADALFNLALLQQRRGRHADAATCWRRYLALDGQSSWALRARRALKFCEMQIARSS